MKRLFLILAFAVLFLIGCSFRDKKSMVDRELYVIHIHGDWCMTCQTVDPVIHSLENYFKEKVDYIVFDETNPKTIKESKKKAIELGLEDLFEYQRHTGEVLYVDKKTKDILAVFAGIDDKDEYINATEKLLKGETIKSHPKKSKSYMLPKPPLEKIKKAKVFIIDIHHDKCATCSITAPVFEQVASQYQNNKDVCFFTFDLSTPQTINETRDLATEVGIKDIYDHYKHTGEVLFVDAATKEIKETVVAETNVVKYHTIIDSILNKLATKS